MSSNPIFESRSSTPFLPTTTESDTQTNENTNFTNQLSKQMSMYRNITKQMIANKYLKKKNVMFTWQVQENRFQINKELLKTNHNKAMSNLRKLSNQTKRELMNQVEQSSLNVKDKQRLITNLEQLQLNKEGAIKNLKLNIEELKRKPKTESVGTNAPRTKTTNSETQSKSKSVDTTSLLSNSSEIETQTNDNTKPRQVGVRKSKEVTQRPNFNTTPFRPSNRNARSFKLRGPLYGRVSNPEEILRKKLQPISEASVNSEVTLANIKVPSRSSTPSVRSGFTNEISLTKIYAPNSVTQFAPTRGLFLVPSKPTSPMRQPTAPPIKYENMKKMNLPKFKINFIKQTNMYKAGLQRRLEQDLVNLLNFRKTGRVIPANDPEKLNLQARIKFIKDSRIRRPSSARSSVPTEIGSNNPRERQNGGFLAPPGIRRKKI